MEADGREPVWPPHATGNMSASNQQQPMQHDGVSSSEGDIQSPMPPPMPLTRRPSDEDEGDNEPESTVPEGCELLGTGDRMNIQHARSPLRSTDNEAMPATSASSSLPDSSQLTIKRNGPTPVHLSINQAIMPSNQAIMPSNQAILSSNQAVLSSNQAIFSSNQAILPSSQVILPSNQAILPHSQAILSSNQAILPGNRAVLQDSQVILPSDILANNHSVHPSNQVVHPSNQVAHPSNLVILSSNQALIPSNEDINPRNQNQPQPAEMIMDLDTGLAAGDNMPNHEDIAGPSGLGRNRRGRPERKSARNYISGAGDQPSHPSWDDCEPVDEEEFLKQGALLSISDKPVISRARASLPSQLQIFKIDNNEVGVFAKRWIPKRTQFGPLEGKQVTRDRLSAGSMKWKFQHEIQGEVYLDCSDEFESNWMTFIRPAMCYSEQNLIAYQLDNEIYFATIKQIDPKSELRVWYAKSYAEQLGEKILEITPEEAAELQDKENSWPCFECSRKFRTSELLQKHLITHDALHTQPKTRGKRGRPRKYPEGYRKRKMAIAKLQSARRLQRKQQKQEVFACNMCPKTFPRPYSLQRHMVMHSGEKKYSCEVCNKTFAHLYNRTRHMKRHQERGEGAGSLVSISIKEEEEADNIFMCSDCDLEFESELLLGLHMFTHTPEIMEGGDLKEFDNDDDEEDHDRLTPTLGQEGEDSNILKANVPTITAPDENGERSQNDSTNQSEKSDIDLRCPDCDELFESRKSLALHATAHGKRRITPHHSQQPEVQYRCDECNKPFRDKVRFDRHSELHNREAKKPIQCEICQKRFLNNSAIACHMKTHTQQKIYKCPFCDAGFERTELLKNHVPCHLVSGSYICPHCPKAFTEYPQVRKHIRGFHSTKEFPCPHCDRIFPRPDKLKLHMLRHSDKKDFMCENCGKQFKRKDKLKEHTLRMHNPEREARNLIAALRPKKQPFKPRIPPTDMHAFTFKCRVCLIGFKRRGMLVNHLAKQHPDMPPETVPELNLPIVKPNRNYFCAYCEKVYKSSSKRKIHILKNHPGAALPPSLRKTKGDPNSPLGDPHTAPAGTTTTHYFACAHCPRQYSTKAKMMDHVRKKHMEPVQVSAVASAIPTLSTSQAGQVTVMQNHQVQMDGVTSIVVAQVAESADGLGEGVHMVHDGQAIPISASVAASLAAAAENNQGHIAVPVSINAANVVHITPHMTTQGPAAAAVQAIASAASAAADNTQPHQITIQEHRLPDGIQTAQIRYVDHTGATIQTETVQAADLLTQAMSELSQTITEFRQQPVDYQQLTQRIIQPQATLLPQTISVAQIPLSGIPVTQIPVSQLPQSSIATITQIPVSQIVTQVTPTTTVDVAQLSQSPTQFQQPQLLHLQNSTQPMSPSTSTSSTTQQPQNNQQQQQIFTSRSWTNYQNNFR